MVNAPPPVEGSPEAQRIRRALEAAAIELLVKAAAGLPRSLQILARAAWLQAAQAGQTVLAADHVQAAIDVVPCVPGREREGLPP